jgi:OOP family OmpA-OmpF porin
MSIDRWFKAAALAAVSLAAVPAFAQTTETELRGPYIGGGIGTGSDTDTTWNLVAGWRLHRNVAVELGYTDLRNLNLNGQPLDKSNTVELSALGILPLNEKFSVFGRLGGYHGQAKGSGFDEKHDDLLFGAGGEFAATRDLGVRLQWTRYSGFGGGGLGSKDEDLLSLNGIYYFR